MSHYTQLAVRVYYYRATSNGHTGDTGDKSTVLRALFANPNLVRLTGRTRCADIDVVASSRQITSSIAAESSVVCPRGVS